MFGGWLSSVDGDENYDAFHYERSMLVERLAAEGRKGRHILLYGRPRQGKSTLVKRYLGERSYVHLHAYEDMSFADISRNYFLALGCSIVVEEKRKRKFGGKAEIKIGGPIVSLGGSAEAGIEGEVTVRSFTADMASPNDVCHVLRQFGTRPVLVIDRFEELGARKRRVVLDFLRLTAESRLLQVILIASSLDVPLEHRERLDFLRHLSVVHVSLLTQVETEAFVKQAFEHLGCMLPSNAGSTIYDLFAGSLDLTRDSCALFAATLRGRSGTVGVIDDAPTRAALLEGIRAQTRAYLLTLLAAMLERGWTLPCYRRPVQSLDAKASEAGVGVATTPAQAKFHHRRPANASPSDPAAAGKDEDDAIADDAIEGETGDLELPAAMATDPVFVDLLRLTQRSPTSSPAGLAPILADAVQLARTILRGAHIDEPVRLTAFSLVSLLGDPTAYFVEPYEPLDEYDSVFPSIGRMLLEILCEADLEQPVVVTAERIAKYLTDKGLLETPRPGRRSAIERVARHVRKLQRQLRLDPPIFKVDAERQWVLLWDPTNASLFGDIRPYLKELLDADDDDPSEGEA